MKRYSKIEKLNAYNEYHSRVTIPNMHYKDDAPMFVAVVGPARSGKTALAGALVGHFAGERVALRGPVTFKGRSRRYTLYESTTDVENVIDTIKVADLVVLTINLDYGLEKETLEAIAMILSHGLTKIMAVLTYTGDSVPQQTRKAVAHRISQEFSFPVKFFDMKRDGIDKIARNLELMKTRPLEWKCTHPHIVVDRQDGEHLYGYVRGGPFRPGTEVHVPGHGDYTVDEIAEIEDPCSSKVKSRYLYNPNCEAPQPQAESSCSEELNLFEGDVRLFDDGDERAGSVFQRDGDDSEPSASDAEVGETEKENESNACSESEHCRSEKPDDGMELLRSRIAGRFKQEAATEEDYVEKFNEEYSEQEKDGLNFLQRRKQEELELKEEFDACAGLIRPGQYCRIKLRLQYDPASILVLGSCLVAENRKIMLQGKAVKNKWQKGDLKSNAPQFVSMGWYRFQTIPLYAQEGKAIKYLKGTGSYYSEIAFYGPAVPLQTNFFIYNAAASFRVVASGQVLNASGASEIRKKLKLVGYPKTLMGNTAIIQSMFSSRNEAAQFSNARLASSAGLRGVLKNAVGKSGEFRATFEGPLSLSDVVFIKTFMPMRPLDYMVHTGPGVRYLRSLREIKESLGLPLHEESVSECSRDADELAAQNSEAARAKLGYKEHRKRREVAKLEKQLPFDMRTVVVCKEEIELPLSPEQQRAKREADEFAELRAARDQEEQQAAEERKLRHLKKKAALAADKDERRRKNAVDAKRTTEMGGRSAKKAHKISRNKQKK
ncbi:ribosome biogenesis protein BMS1 [Pancytospora philotis]|nr:ribosome biogenesis protein BMS1 [Pancytospora philotis]